MPLDEAVVLGDAGLLEAGPLGDEVADIAFDVDAEPFGRGPGRCPAAAGELVERRLRGAEGEPVGADIGQNRARRVGNAAISRDLRPRRIGISERTVFQSAWLPAEVRQVEGEDRLRRIDGDDA